MGPGFVRRDVLISLRSGGEKHPGFNGARLRSPGCARIGNSVDYARFMLQWGPASFAGMCAIAGARAALATALQWGPASFAGMCPSASPGLARSRSSFNGARLRSPGCARRCLGPCRRRPRRFNGARLRSPGCAHRRRVVVRVGHRASMGPGFVRRDVLYQYPAAAPAVECFNGARLRSPGCANAVAQAIGEGVAASMGPGFVRRDVPRTTGNRTCRRTASMGPGFVRRDVRPCRYVGHPAVRASMGPGFVRRDVHLGLRGR